MIEGIDISKWNGTIDFLKVRGAGVKFAILRSSYRRATDKKFFEYVAGCREAGIHILGVYHFIYALSNEDALKEAQYCISQVEKAGLPKGTIIFSDFEYDTVKSAAKKGVTLTRTHCNEFTRLFCEYCASQGYPVGIYTNIDYHKNWYGTDLLNKYIVWLADYKGDPNYPCLIQQYTSGGSIPGIAGSVDRNRYFGDEFVIPESTVKDVDTIAREVLDGKWGNGADRRKALTEAGYNPDVIQTRVNALLGGDLTVIAKEVIAGKWGNGLVRKSRLTNAGYDYSRVQQIVKQLLK